VLKVFLIDRAGYVREIYTSTFLDTRSIMADLETLLMERAEARVSASEESRPPVPGASPFAGSWAANIEKSKRHPNHLFRSATLRFEVDGDTVTLMHGGVNASGQEESGTVTLQADGKEHPVAQAHGVVAVTTWVGARILATVAVKDGAAVGEQWYEVSADGRTLTAKVWGTDAGGRRFEQTIVFDRR
jgi:hypothetical protein